VISSNAHGELIDPKTLLPFNKRFGWKSKSGNLMLEFFKWLGNLSYNDMAKFAKHILQINTGERAHDYPKVTIKQVSSVLESCYTCKEWVERRKRKYLVKKEMDHLDSSLGLLNAFKEVNVEKWREFKASRNITSATMNVLFEQPGDEYWKEAKQTKAKSKEASEISPYASEFFRVFLEHRLFRAASRGRALPSI